MVGGSGDGAKGSMLLQTGLWAFKARLVHHRCWSCKYVKVEDCMYRFAPAAWPAREDSWLQDGQVSNCDVHSNESLNRGLIARIDTLNV